MNTFFFLLSYDASKFRTFRDVLYGKKIKIVKMETCFRKNDKYNCFIFKGVSNFFTVTVWSAITYVP